MKTIKIEKEVKLPGTDIVLEEGDKIMVLKESTFQDSELGKLVKHMLRMAKAADVYNDGPENLMSALGMELVWSLGAMMGDKAEKDFASGVRTARKKY